LCLLDFFGDYLGEACKNYSRAASFRPQTARAGCTAEMVGLEKN